jgi:hypothetical protein
MKAKPPIHIVFANWTVTVTFKNRSTEPSKIVTVGVFIDLEQLTELVIKATGNKTKKAHDGALHVELHTVREVPNV